MEQTCVLTRPAPTREPVTKQPRLWNVVLLDDQAHSYEYVIRMVQRLFGKSIEQAFMTAQTVDEQGRAICLTTHREYAELKVEQIHAFGPDQLVADCCGSMSALLEPAECEGGEDER